MDEYSRRTTIETVRERAPDRAQVESIISQFEVLVDMANDIARVVWALRWPRAGYEPSFEIHFGEEYRHDSKLGDQYTRAISAGFYAHQNNDSFDFPFEYLFMDYAEIQTAEDIRADEEHRKAQAEQQRRANDQRSRDIANLKRLQELYPDV